MPDIGEIQVPRQQRFASLTDTLCDLGVRSGPQPTSRANSAWWPRAVSAPIADRGKLASIRKRIEDQAAGSG
jgi:hypothetical protein